MNIIINAQMESSNFSQSRDFIALSDVAELRLNDRLILDHSTYESYVVFTY